MSDYLTFFFPTPALNDSYLISIPCVSLSLSLFSLMISHSREGFYKMESSPTPSQRPLPSTPRTVRSTKHEEAPTPSRSGNGNNSNSNSNNNSRPAYGQYQLDLYTESLLTGQKPIVTCDPNKLEEQARAAMSTEGFDYVMGGAGEQSTVVANRKAFAQWRLVPRMLRGAVQRRDLGVKLFGRTYGKVFFFFFLIHFLFAFHPISLLSSHVSRTYTGLTPLFQTHRSSWRP